MGWDLPLLAAGDPAGRVSVEQDGVLLRRTVLPGGVRVLTERLPGLRSVTFGAWLAVGSRDEVDGEQGSTHFLEHLLFKGTHRRSARAIAEALDAAGGESNALTGKEYTCYYARVLDEDLPLAVDVVLDMVTSARIDAGDLETERGVILEELAMNDDDPSDVAHERLAAQVLAGSTLGRPIGGTKEIIRTVSRDGVMSHYHRHYRPETLVITAVGSVDHDAVCALVTEALTRGGWALAADAVPAARRPSRPAAAVRPIADPVRINRPVEQTSVVLGTPGPAARDPRRFELTALTTILGGGMSSRLFQAVREDKGLAYTTYAFAQQHADAGIVGMYAGCSPRNADAVEELMRAELLRLARDGVEDDELQRVIGQLRGSLVLGLEETGSRMTRLGRAEIVTGSLLSTSEALEAFAAVTADQIVDLAQELAGQPWASVRVGPGQG